MVKKVTLCLDSLVATPHAERQLTGAKSDESDVDKRQISVA